MPHERPPKQTLYVEVNGKRPVRRSRTRWLDYIEDLVWNRLGLNTSEVQFVLVDREVWRLNLELLPPQPSRKRKKSKTAVNTSQAGTASCFCYLTSPVFAHVILPSQLKFELPSTATVRWSDVLVL